MELTLSVAKYLNYLYKTQNNKDMEQSRMHKLMYLVQRESLMYHKVPLFSAQFQGWKYGPVLLELEKEYVTGDKFHTVSDMLSLESRNLVKSVYERYQDVSTWKLGNLCHGEFSWQWARRNLNKNDNGNCLVKLSDMKLDAARELLRRKEA